MTTGWATSCKALRRGGTRSTFFSQDLVCSSGHPFVLLRSTLAVKHVTDLKAACDQHIAGLAQRIDQTHELAAS